MMHKPLQKQTSKLTERARGDWQVFAALPGPHIGIRCANGLHGSVGQRGAYAGFSVVDVVAQKILCQQVVSIGFNACISVI